jgi:hypothetical protein
MYSDSPTFAAAPDALAPSAIVRFQTAISVVLMLLVSGVFVDVDLLARSESVAHWFNAYNRTQAAISHEHYVPMDQFMDKMDYLWIKQLPRADFSRGGVELFGSSVSVYCLEDWALPPDQAALIHDYGYMASSMTQAGEFIRFLIDHKGLLAAGPDKSLIMLGLTYADLAEPPEYFKESILRSGNYLYDEASGISPAQKNRDASDG